jgi:hypothetical protein
MSTQESGTQHNIIPPLPVEEERRRFRIHPGLIVGVLGVLLLAMIAIGVFVNRKSEPGVRATTIAELRADPEGWDNRRVTLTGTAESVRELPVLSQYAIYTFRDETGSMLALTRNGAPPDDGQQLQVEAVFHSKVRLDDELKEIVSDQLGPLAGSVVSTLVPGVPLDVVYLGHDSFELLGTPEGG